MKAKVKPSKLGLPSQRPKTISGFHWGKSLAKSRTTRARPRRTSSRMRRVSGV
jgi:hypothetical protein